MKATEILTKALKIKEYASEPTSAIYQSELKKIIDELIQDSETEIRSETATTTGKKNIYNACMKILNNTSEKTSLKKAYDDGESVTVCDGFALIRFNKNDAPPLPTWKAGETNYPNLKNIIDDAKSNQTPATLPTVTELKNFIKIEKAKQKATNDKNIIIYEINGVLVNANYLLNILQALPNCNARITCQEWKRSTAPIYFEAPSGDGVLCVMRCRS